MCYIIIYIIYLYDILFKSCYLFIQFVYFNSFNQTIIKIVVSLSRLPDHLGVRRQNLTAKKASVANIFGFGLMIIST